MDEGKGGREGRKRGKDGVETGRANYASWAYGNVYAMTVVTEKLKLKTFFIVHICSYITL